MTDGIEFSTGAAETSPQANVDNRGALDPPGDVEEAAAEALARAKALAVGKGLRPGSRAGRRRRPAGATFSSAHADARDPVPLADQIDRLTMDRGWNLDVAVGAVMGRWPVIVGIDVARHVTPVTYDDGVLTVRADSTAWATQMRLISASLLTRIADHAGPGTVTSLKVTGPAAPSWSKGLRKTHGGRGPRDTYG